MLFLQVFFFFEISFLHLLGPTWDAIVMPARDRCHAATALLLQLLLLHPQPLPATIQSLLLFLIQLARPNDSDENGVHAP